MWTLLLCTLAYGQDAQTFDPIPADYTQEGEVLQGILVDEATFKELVQLRTDAQAYRAEVQSFEDWKTQEDKRFAEALGAVKLTCEEGTERLVAHYESALKREKKKDWLQRHGFPIGVTAGLVGATAIYLGATRFYGEVLSSGAQL